MGARALEQALERADSAWGRPVRAVFNRYADTLPLLFLNTTRVHDGLPGVFASMRLCGDSDAVSRRTDLLAQRFAGDADLAFSTAAILSARFPYMSPAGGLYFNGRWNHYVDGGYFDNSGAGIVTEILRHIATLRMNSPDTAWVQRVRPGDALWLAGFSFGSWLAAKAARHLPVKQLILVAPPVQKYPIAALPHPPCPWLVVQGEDDEVVDPQAVFDWVAQTRDPPALVRMPQTGHFFHRKLMDLRGAVKNAVKGNLPPAR